MVNINIVKKISSVLSLRQAKVIHLYLCQGRSCLVMRQRGVLFKIYDRMGKIHNWGHEEAAGCFSVYFID